MKQDNSYFDAAERKALLAKLKAAKVTKVILSVYGGGDSGEIDGIEFFNIKNIQMPISDINHELYSRTGDLLIETLENQGADWWNNEGGDGSIELNVKTGTVSITIDVNEITSETVVDIKDAKWSEV